MSTAGANTNFSHQLVSPVSARVYSLDIGELDELMKDICVAASIDPISYTQTFQPTVRQMFLDTNADGSFWVRT